jgi:UDP-GlcNAc:undecaprenyl-phosphate GlcNAc-1-phosphate transferase
MIGGRSMYFNNILPIISALVLSLGLNYLFMYLFIKMNFVDNPDGILKPHKVSVPLSGGIAIALTFLILEMVFKIPINPFILIIPYMFLLLGMRDDINNLNPYIRLFLEFLFIIPLFLLKTHLWLDLPLFISVIFSYILIIGFINSFNLMDGIDGLSGSLAIVALLSLTFLAPSNVCGDVRIINYALIPAILGFLYLNLYPAKTFLGDGGAYFIGFMIVYEIILINVSFNLPLFLASLYMIGIFIFDTFFAMTRRFILKKNIFGGDRTHLYDILHSGGLSVPGTVMIMVVIQILFSIVGFAVSRASIPVSIIISLSTIIICSIMGLVYLKRNL